MEKFAELVVGEFSTIHQQFAAIHKEFYTLHRTLDTRHERTDKRFDKVDESVHAIWTEVYDVHRAIGRIEERLHNHDGFAKEVDHVLGRITRIEKHLCIAER